MEGCLGRKSWAGSSVVEAGDGGSGVRRERNLEACGGVGWVCPGGRRDRFLEVRGAEGERKRGRRVQGEAGNGD